MNYCKDCVYLGPELQGQDDDCYDVPSGFHKCELIKHNVISYSRVEYLPDEKEKACVEDGSGYYAALCVKDDFGCNQFKQKDTVSTVQRIFEGG